MRTLRPTNSTWALLSSVLALPLLFACGSPSEDTNDSDLAAAQEAEGVRLTDADKTVDFANEEVPDTDVTAPDFPWGQLFWFTDDPNTKVGRDWFPVGWDYAKVPFAAVKLIIAIPNKVGDWFRGSNYANFTLPNKTSAPLKVNARLALDNLNWYFSKGRASLRVCNVRANGEEYNCDRLGSVKDGTRTTSEYPITTDTTPEHPRARLLKVRHYVRNYPLVIPPGESLHVQVKHKLECNLHDTYVSGDFRTCAVKPSPSIRFTKE